MTAKMSIVLVVDNVSTEKIVFLVSVIVASLEFFVKKVQQLLHSSLSEELFLISTEFSLITKICF